MKGKNGNAQKKIRSHTKTIIRFVLIALLLLIEFSVICLGAFFLNRYAVWVFIVINMLSFLIAIPLVSQERNAAYKLYWMCVLLVLPVVGHIMYILWGGMIINKKTHAKIQNAIDIANSHQLKTVYFEDADESRKMISEYLNFQGFPLYGNTEVEYFELGEKAFEDMICRMKEAKEYIFMSFFIIADGEIWDRMSEILEEKKKQGLRICIMYDDAGSVLQLSDTTVLELKKLGIEIRNFNPVNKNYRRLFLNFRNHQKILIIDGRHAYTGGINISDRYANLISPYGHWKDTGIRMTGDAVYSMQLFFAGMWNASGGKISPGDYPPVHTDVKSPSHCQPFVDGPSNNPNNPAMDMFMHQIITARKKVNIMTPYLIIDDVMQEILILAVRSGVAVRIITPGVPDKKTIQLMTQKHYGKLLAAGVKIYEYEPGFIHAKLCGNEFSAVIGTINMDFRSFFLHYENGVWIPDGDVLNAIERDFEETLLQCREVTYEEWKKRPLIKKILQEALYFLKCQF